ncbi:MAG: mechanosensitive ion channel [Gammaproteobacteria bacterium]|nr:mechanosensitive ion channel [Gammaproteobacteria bacterium]
MTELKQLLSDFHMLWGSGDRQELFWVAGLVIGVFFSYYMVLALGNRLIKEPTTFSSEAMAIALRASIFGISWLGLNFFFRDFGAWGDSAQRFLGVFLTVGILGRGVMQLPWPITFKRHMHTILVLAGYGGFWLVPSLLAYSRTLGSWLNGLILFVLVLLVVRLVWSKRFVVATVLTRLQTAQLGFVFAGLLRMVAPIWHWLILAATLAIGAGGIILGPAVAGFLGLATAQTVVYFAFALLAGRMVEGLAGCRAFLPLSMAERYPAFSKRINKWIPRILHSLHVIVAFVLVVAVADAWKVVDVEAILLSQAGLASLSALRDVLFIILLTAVVWLLVMSWIEDRLNPDIGQGEPGSREKTLLTLFRSAAAIAIIVMAGMVMLAELGMNIGPLIAGAGVVGLAVGFGAQKLVQDIITGIFIQIEDAIHTDDYITAAGISGTVERLSLRSIALRDLTGTLHIIPFSSVDLVSNFTRDFGYHLGVYGVAYRENIGEVIEQLQVAYDRLIKNGDVSDAIAGPLEIDGVTALDSSSVNIRVRIRTTPGMQWAVGRAFNRVVKDTFDDAGIEIPFPHMTLWFGEDKTGNAPAAPLRMVKEE